MDGDIDYSKYSDDDLNEALRRIDKQRYPKNYANLLKEAASRPFVQPPQSGRPRRPALANTIVAFYGIASVLTGLAALLILVTWPAAKEALDRNSTATLVTLAAAKATLISAGTIQLFRMKRSSFYFYCAALVLTTVQTLANLVTGTPLGSVLGGYFLIGYTPLLLTSIYTWRLRRQNVLT